MESKLASSKSNKKNNNLCVTFGDLAIKKSSAMDFAIFQNVDVFNVLLVNAITGQVFNSNVRISDFFKNQIDYQKYFKKLSSDIGVNYIRVKKDENHTKEQCISILHENLLKNGFIIINDLTVLKFFKSLRNAIAHRNILHYKDKYIYFCLDTKDAVNSLDAAWNQKIRMLVIVDELDDIVEYGKHISKYLSNPENRKKLEKSKENPSKV